VVHLGLDHLCLNPKLPGEMGIQHTVASKSQVATMRALSSNKGALDCVFNVIEGFTCQDNNDLVNLRERRIIGTLEPLPFRYVTSTIFTTESIVNVGRGPDVGGQICDICLSVTPCEFVIYFRKFSLKFECLPFWAILLDKN
jgi:hypothetical protein